MVVEVDQGVEVEVDQEVEVEVDRDVDQEVDQEVEVVVRLLLAHPAGVDFLMETEVVVVVVLVVEAEVVGGGRRTLAGHRGMPMVVEAVAAGGQQTLLKTPSTCTSKSARRKSTISTSIGSARSRTNTIRGATSREARGRFGYGEKFQKCV